MVKFSIAVSTVLLATSAYAQSILEALSSTPELSQLHAVVGRASPALQTTIAGLNDVTILAPSNNAFRSFLSNLGAPLDTIDSATIDTLLTYHVLNGTLRAAALTTEGGAVAQTFLTDAQLANLGGESNAVFASAFGSTGLQEKGDLRVYSGVGPAAGVSKADVGFDGGVVHVIDAVLNLPKKCSETAEAAKLTSLIAALQKANLTNTLDTTPSITCFAPTNEAFEAAGINLDELSPEQVANVLKLHVVPAVAFSSELEDGQEVETLGGQSVTITKKDGKLWINDIEVAQANVVATNGVVHVLNGVILPSQSSPNATTSGAVPTSTDPVDSAAGKVGLTVASVFGVAAAFAAALI